MAKVKRTYYGTMSGFAVSVLMLAVYLGGMKFGERLVPALVFFVVLMTGLGLYDDLRRR